MQELEVPSQEEMNSPPPTEHPRNAGGKVSQVLELDPAYWDPKSSPGGCFSFSMTPLGCSPCSVSPSSHSEMLK